MVDAPQGAHATKQTVGAGRIRHGALLDRARLARCRAAHRIHAVDTRLDFRGEHAARGFSGIIVAHAWAHGLGLGTRRRHIAGPRLAARAHRPHARGSHAVVRGAQPDELGRRAPAVRGPGTAPDPADARAHPRHARVGRDQGRAGVDPERGESALDRHHRFHPRAVRQRAVAARPATISHRHRGQSARRVAFTRR